LIYYLVTRAHSYTIAMFVQGWGKALAGRVTVGLYDGLLAGGALPPGGVVIFSDLDRLTLAERSALAPIHARLSRALNDPTRSLLRFQMLRAVHERGINRFNVHRTGEVPARFPVFLRPDAGFLNDPPKLLHAVASIPAGHIAVEFCDTADADGVYRKYGAYVVGERIVPRHLFFSRDWLVKSPDLLGAEQLAEERAYVETNPHADQLLQICRLARISWGRVDYALLNGKVQVWEINTNPMFSFPGPEAPARDPVHRIAAQGVVDALLSL
jgi:hypothetical protein